MLARAVELASTFAGNSPIAVQSTVRTLRHQKVKEYSVNNPSYRLMLLLCSLMVWTKRYNEKQTAKQFATRRVIICSVSMQ